jgi:hypothetical protein
MRFAHPVVKLDIDNGDPPTMAFLHYRLTRAGYRGVEWISFTRSPGGQGWHVCLLPVPRPTTAIEVAAVQLLLGSDPEREAVVLHRARLYPHTPPFARGWFNVVYTKHSARSRRLRVRNDS